MKTLTHTDVTRVVDEVLHTLTKSKQISLDPTLDMVVFDSPDQMHLLVAIEALDDQGISEPTRECEHAALV